MSTTAHGWRFGADVGGTFTDVVLADPDGRVHTTKVLSTPNNYSDAVLEGLVNLAATAECPLEEILAVVHATTVATNSILTRQGGLTALVTTRGFRDVLEFRRIRFPETYNLKWEKPPPLVERRLRVEVDERVSAQGELLTPLKPDQVREVLARLIEDEGVDAIAVCLLNAYVNPAHEQQIGQILNSEYPGVQYSLSSDVLPEIKEYERTSTTVLNAYLKPVVSRYVEDLRQKIADAGSQSGLYLMQSSGGVMTAGAAAQHPIHIVESGAAAGLIGSCEVLRAANEERAITFDMGGTTAKASLVEKYVPFRTSEYELGGSSISLGSRLLRGAGDLLRVPAIEVVEIGAGAGSIVHFDVAGAVRVGPQSAGASPGPVCYRQGGEEPTVTDANVVLGYLPDTGLLGGSFPIDTEAARIAIQAVAERLGLSLLEAAHGIHRIANAAMARAIRSVSTERGRDPREHSLIVYGGSGPVHAVEMARTLGIPTVIVPPSPGVFAALGLLFAPIERRLVKTVPGDLRQISVDRMTSAFEELEDLVVAELSDDGYALEAIQLARSADLHYKGQWFELEIAVPRGVVTPEVIDEMHLAFASAYEETYGYTQTNQVIELVNVRVAASVAVDPPSLIHAGAEQPSERGTRLAYFGGGQEPVITTVLKDRASLAGTEAGPLIIDEFDTTIVAPPGSSVRLDRQGNVVIGVDATRLSPEVGAEGSTPANGPAASGSTTVPGVLS